MKIRKKTLHSVINVENMKTKIPGILLHVLVICRTYWTVSECINLSRQLGILSTSTSSLNHFKKNKRSLLLPQFLCLSLATGLQLALGPSLS